MLKAGVRIPVIPLAASLAVLAGGLLAVPQAALAQTAATAHVFLNEADLKWGPGPPSLPAGAQAAVLLGDPSKPGPFVLRLKFPAGFAVAPHTHPTDELVTVVSGRMDLAMGDTVEPGRFKSLSEGGFFTAPAGMAHYARAPDGAVVQINGQGPFQIKYVNPADDPRGRVR